MHWGLVTTWAPCGTGGGGGDSTCPSASASQRSDKPRRSGESAAIATSMLHAHPTCDGTSSGPPPRHFDAFPKPSIQFHFSSGHRGARSVHRRSPGRLSALQLTPPVETFRPQPAPCTLDAGDGARACRQAQRAAAGRAGDRECLRAVRVRLRRRAAAVPCIPQRAAAGLLAVGSVSARSAGGGRVGALSRLPRAAALGAVPLVDVRRGTATRGGAGRHARAGAAVDDDAAGVFQSRSGAGAGVRQSGRRRRRVCGAALGDGGAVCVARELGQGDADRQVAQCAAGVDRRRQRGRNAARHFRRAGGAWPTAVASAHHLRGDTQRADDYYVHQRHHRHAQGRHAPQPGARRGVVAGARRFDRLLLRRCTASAGRPDRRAADSVRGRATRLLAFSGARPQHGESCGRHQALAVSHRLQCAVGQRAAASAVVAVGFPHLPPAARAPLPACALFPVRSGATARPCEPVPQHGVLCAHAAGLRHDRDHCGSVHLVAAGPPRLRWMRDAVRGVQTGGHPRHEVHAPRQAVSARRAVHPRTDRHHRVLQERAGHARRLSGRRRLAGHRRCGRTERGRHAVHHRPQEEYLQIGPGRVRGGGGARVRVPQSQGRRPGVGVRQLARDAVGGGGGARS
eukprot:ctg_544.g318